MSYIPIVMPPTTPQPPSPRTRELAEILAKVLEEYQKAHPSVTGAELRAAIRLAQSSTGKDKAPVALALSLGLGLLVGGLTLGLVFVGRSGQIELGSSMIMVVLGITAFIGILAAVIKIASR